MKREIDNIINHAEVSEKAIEKYISEKIKELGGLCLKYNNANQVGYPDRIIIMGGGISMWAELKSKGKKPTAIQNVRINQLKTLNQPVWVIDSRKEVDQLISQYRRYLITKDNKDLEQHEI